VALVQVSRDKLDLYEELLTKFCNKHLGWLQQETTTIPSNVVEEMTNEGLLRNGYHVDKESVQLHFAIRQQLQRMVLENKRPLPKCKLIVPTAIAYWNKHKVFIDVFSRLLSHFKLYIGQANPVQHLVFHFIFSGVVAAHLITQYENMDMSLFSTNSIVTYDEIKKKLSKKGSVNDYLSVLMSEFKIP
jgi:hypothetical protein